MVSAISELPTDVRSVRAESADSLIGLELKGSYRIDRLIARGGMGAVYEAQHLRLRRRVAVKVLLNRQALDPDIVSRFRREADIMANVGHPHIVQVLDLDETEESGPFFVMEYLEGETLARRVRRTGAWPILDAVRVASEAAAALAQVHAAGIIHCDVKPTNLFLVRVNGQTDFVKLLDFGVSSELSRGTHHAAGDVAGTPNYMAPEQAGGRKDLDHRTDQFALAAIEFELLSGRKAFPGSDTDHVLEYVRRVAPPPLSEVAPWVPRVFDRVLARALSKNPGDRYSSISAFAWALGNAVIDSGMDLQPRRRPGSGAGRYSVPAEPNPDPGVESSRPFRSSEPPTSVQGRGRSLPAEEQEAASRQRPRAAPDLLLQLARDEWTAGHLDEAVELGEQILELAVYDRSPAALRALASGIRMLDAIFEARVGPPDRKLAVGPALHELRHKLSPRAVELVATVDEPTPVEELVTSSGMPRRDCVRLIAGLLRRGVLCEHS
jgi:serine/threonine protein kinase